MCHGAVALERHIQICAPDGADIFGFGDAIFAKTCFAGP